MNKAITVFVSLKSFDQRKLTMEKAKRHFILFDFPLPNWVRTRSIGRWTATLAKCCLARVWGDADGDEDHDEDGDEDEDRHRRPR